MEDKDYVGKTENSDDNYLYLHLHIYPRLGQKTEIKRGVFLGVALNQCVAVHSGCKIQLARIFKPPDRCGTSYIHFVFRRFDISDDTLGPVLGEDIKFN